MNSIESEENYEGSWEGKGRSSNTAAVLGLLGIGVLYFYAQTFLAIVFMAFSGAETGALDEAETFLEKIAATMEIYADPILAAVVLSQYLFMLLPAFWLVKRWHTAKILDYMRWRSSSVWEVVLAIFATLAFVPAGTFIATELTRWMDIPDILLEVNSRLFAADSLPQFFWLVLVVAITPAICEEGFFRGYVQRTLERTTRGKSVIIVGVIFGLFHMQPLGLITLALMGVLFGFFYYRSKSLLPAMTAHFTNNFLAIYVLYQTPEFAGVELAGTEQIPLLWVAVSLPIGIALVCFYHKITAHKIADA